MDNLQEIPQSTKPFDIEKVIIFGGMEPREEKKEGGERGCHWIKERSSKGDTGGYCDKPAMGKNKYCSAHMKMYDERMEIVKDKRPLKGNQLKESLESLVPKRISFPSQSEDESEEDSEESEEEEIGFVPEKCVVSPVKVEIGVSSKEKDFEPIYLEIRIGNRKARIFID